MLVSDFALFSKKGNEVMKRGKRLTRAQKECLSAHRLKADDFQLVSESEFYYKVIHKETKQIKTLDKFRRVKR